MRSQVHDWGVLFSALVDENIDEREFARLNVLIESDAGARAHFIRYMHHHADLADLAFKDSETNLTASLAPPKSRRWAALPQAIAAVSQKVSHIARRPTSISLTAAVIVVGILICGMTLMTIPLYRQTAREALDVEHLAVAKITRLHQARWPAAVAEGGPDQFLHAGERLELREGFAEILFYNGASVILQGPSVFHLESPSSGRLDQGRLTAIVPPKAVGFSIRSPCMHVVDLGTEFGVLVEKDGATKVDIFSGRVQVAWLDEEQIPLQRMTLGSGESARVTMGVNGIEKVEQSPSKFVRTKVLNELITEQGYARWREFAASLKAEPNVVAFYDFTPREQSPGLLINTTSPTRFAGRIDGPMWAAGRWEEKQALRFEQADDCVHLDFSGQTYEQLTFSAWVNVERLAQPLTSVLHSASWNRDGAVHWTILTDGRLELAVFGNEPSVVHSDAGSIQRLPGRWMHLAFVYDARNKELRFYVNGANRGTRTYTQALRADLQQVQLGNWNQQDRHLAGRMDEVIVFQEALSDKEIQKLYASGAP